MAKPSTRRVGFAPLTFDNRAQRYRDDKTGKFLAPSKVRAIIDDSIVATGDRMAAIGSKLKAGSIGTAEFRRQMAIEIKALHLSEVAAANGGFHDMSQADYGRAGQRIQFNLKALDGFVSDIQSYPEMLTDEGHPERMDFEQRLRMYAEAGRNTFARAKDVAMNEADFKFKSNKLEPLAHHCTGTISCPAMTALGRVPIDDARYRLEGDRACLTRCRCETVYHMAAA